MWVWLSETLYSRSLHGTDGKFRLPVCSPLVRPLRVGLQRVGGPCSEVCQRGRKATAKREVALQSNEAFSSSGHLSLPSAFPRTAQPYFPPV